MMMSPLMSIAALALALQTQPSTTDEPETAQTAQTTEAVETTEAAEVDEKSRIVCKRTAIIGSKFKKRICGTVKEWEVMARRHSATAAEMRKKGKGGTASEVGT